MQFVLMGFSESRGFRVFIFEGIAPDRTRSPFTVKTDLALARQYGIRLQELPLLCRAVLERSYSGLEKRAFTYTEDDMRQHAGIAASREEALRKRKPPRKPVSERVGAAWRGPVQ